MTSTSASSEAVSADDYDSGLLAGPDQRRSSRLAFYAHVGSLLVAFPLLLYLVRHQWFLYDDWSYTGFIRSNLERGDYLEYLFAPYNGHWSTVHNLLQEVLYRSFGLRTYVPYLVPTLLAFLVVVAEMRVIMRRAGVGPWLSTAFSGLVLVSAPAGGMIVFGTHFAFFGATAFGLAQLLLADHDGPVDRRDWIGAVFGLMALATSNIAVALVGTVGLTLGLRRRWQAMAVGVAPLAIAWIAWYVMYGRRSTPTIDRSLLFEIPEFMWRGISATVDGLTQVPGTAPILIVGLGVLALLFRISPFERGTAAAIALAAGGVGFYATVAYDRVGAGVSYATQDRFMFIAVLYFLPLIAVVSSRIAHRGRWPLAAVAAFLLWALLGNAVDMVRLVDTEYRPLAVDLRRRVLATLTLPRLPDYPEWYAPFGVTGGVLTVDVMNRLTAVNAWPSLDSVTESDRLSAAMPLQVLSSEKEEEVPASPPTTVLSASHVSQVGVVDGCVTLAAASASATLPSVTVDSAGLATVQLHSTDGGTIAVTLHNGDSSSSPRELELSPSRPRYLAIDVPGTTTEITLVDVGTLEICNLAATSADETLRADP